MGQPLTARCDLHIHTALSPCGEPEMSPARIARMAVARGLHVIAITDHNSAENVEAVKVAGERLGLWVIPGIEVQTVEEVHVLGFFDTISGALSCQEMVYATLPREKNREEFFGEQLIMDYNDNVVGKCDRLLLTSARLSFEEAVSAITENGGMAIAAHVDRPAFSVIRTLGFIPEGARIEAVEVSPRRRVEDVLREYPSLERFPAIVSSDAHRLEDMARGVTTLELSSRCLDGLRTALALGARCYRGDYGCTGGPIDA
ncbi:MAG TPA: PHP domain-containing protein [Firmicutes bacterium]|nr:PHP domain-containing protein [Bacillota bacterium]